MLFKSLKPAGKTVFNSELSETSDKTCPSACLKIAKALFLSYSLSNKKY